jgi:RpiB/LacA/LacB family sugar-phosphate isomerase
MKKTNILIPIAGRGQRFVDQGYVMPKQLIMVDDKQMIDWSLDSIKKKDECNLIFAIRRDHISNFSLDKILKTRYGDDIKIIVIDKITRGSVETCLQAEEYIDNDDPLVVYTLDVFFEPFFDPTDIDTSINGSILTFKSNNPAYSYASLDKNKNVIKTAEKEVISENAAVGVYTFTKGSEFVRYAKQMIDLDLTTNNEFYICPLYNLMIQNGCIIKTDDVEKMHLMGTPEELNFFVTHSLKTFGDKPIALCADHSGWDLKEQAKTILDKYELPYTDFGTFVDKDCDYNDYVFQVTDFINKGNCDFALAFCRTGQGMNISGNKQKGIRSALVFNEYTAEYAVRHNCANYFSIPSKFVDKELLDDMIYIWINTTFDGGRHATRIQKAEDGK